MHYTFDLSGTCAKIVDFDLDETGKLHNVRFLGGCDGNLKAVGRLTEGMDAKAAADCLEGNLCRSKGTSCADQFAKAVRKALAQGQSV
ncbi:MAG: TIGR03905 family TSCPD domain-containing protein [Succinatimonas sp.]|nr:TIGR03905 family TSCPD domain-containing protein [Succinatimonas sp.]